jgi:hypothetical protein
MPRGHARVSEQTVVDFLYWKPVLGIWNVIIIHCQLTIVGKFKQSFKTGVFMESADKAIPQGLTIDERNPSRLETQTSDEFHPRKALHEKVKGFVVIAKFSKLDMFQTSVGFESAEEHCGHVTWHRACVCICMCISMRSIFKN